MIVSIENAERRGLKARINPENFSGSYRFFWNGRKKVTWEVAGNEIKFHPSENYRLLQIEDRVEIFNKILSHYRLRSTHPQHIYSAALGITNTGRIFVAVNTQAQKEYHKDCAEVNMTNAMIAACGGDESVNFDEIHLQMGFYHPDKEKMQRNGLAPIESGSEQPYCTCGKCTDNMAVHTSENAVFVTYPANDGTKPILIDRDATSINGVKPGHVWVTKYNVLLYGSSFDLSAREQKYGRKFLAALTEDRSWSNRFTPSYTKENIGPEFKDLNAELMGQVLKAMNKTIKDDRAKEIFLQNNLSSSSLNNFMVDRIAAAYQAHPRSLAKPGEENKPGGVRNVNKVRCVVVRLNDGTLHSHVECVGPKDNASPFAESVLAAKAGEKLNNITDIWVQEMRPDDIAIGVMHTSSKEGLERTGKKKAKALDDNDPKNHVLDSEGDVVNGTIRVHFIASNPGNLSNAIVESITRYHDLNEIFASRFLGVKADPNARKGTGLQ